MRGSAPFIRKSISSPRSRWRKISRWAGSRGNSVSSTGARCAATRAKATETVQALLDLYGAGLERIVEEIALRDEGEIAQALAGDELVSHLLLLHGLHPEPLEDRVRGALEEVRPYLESHGGDVELLGLEGGVARLALEGSCSGCPSSTMTLKLAIENAIRKAAPEIEEVLADGAAAPAAPAGGGLLEINPVPGPAAGPAHDELNRSRPDRLLDSLDEDLDQIGHVLNRRLGEDLQLLSVLVGSVSMNAIVPEEDRREQRILRGPVRHHKAPRSILSIYRLNS